jgi:hypothetical protein
VGLIDHLLRIAVMNPHSTDNQSIPWHRLFGLTLTDYFYNTAYEVELEKDLSLKQQLLDVVIIEKKGGKVPEILPDGLDNLSAHNLMTYKSHRERLDAWTIEELCGHYVNYRKQTSPSFDDLLPVEAFQLYAVSTRYPEKLSAQIDFSPVKPGIYDVRWGVRPIRIIVLSRITQSERNAPWLMFSAVSEKVKYGVEQYSWNSPVSGVINKLFKKYQTEGVAMPYTIEDFQREIKEEVLSSLTEDDIQRLMENLKPEDRLKGLKTEDLLKALKTEDRLKGLKPEDLLKQLKPEEIEKYLKRIKKTQ